MIDQQQSNETELLNPYVGPRSFSTEQFHLFKGRTVETDELLNLLLARRLVLFYAQSGAGKTSLLNAGLIPTLQQAKEEFEILPVGRVGDSVELPEQVDNIFVFNLLVSLGVSQQNNLLAGLSLNEFLLDLVYDGENFFHTSENPDLLHAPDTTGWQEGEEFVPVKPRVLIIDQFEEIFTVHPEFEDQRKDFFRQISEALAADPYLYVLLSMRGDYYNRMTPYVHLLPDSLRSRYNMEPMREAAALQAVMEPAKQLGRPFTPQVAQKLITYLRRVQTDQQGINSGEDLLGPYVETVQLQVVCFQLWKRLQDVPGNRITQEDVDEVARRLFAELPQQKSAEADPEEDPLATIINTSLSSYYEQAIFQILQEPTVTGIDEYQLRHWFSEELITDVGTRNLLPRGEHETKGIPETAVNLLDKKHHLVRDDMRGGRPFIELVHDSFVEPILSANQRWDENRYRTYPWLEDASRYQENADPALLLRGNRLQAALRQAKKMVGLPEPAQLFLRASQAAEEERERQRELKEKQLEEEKRQQELAHERALAEEHRKRAEEAEKAKSRQSILTTVAVVLLLLAIVGGLLAFGQRQDAVAAQATSESVAETAQSVAETAVAVQSTAEVIAIREQEAKDNALEAQNNAIQQQQIADALRLAAQAKEHLNSGETTSALLLSIEANKALESLLDANDTRIKLTQDIAQGTLLEALFNASTSSQNTNQENGANFIEEFILPEEVEDAAKLYPGPVPNSLATIQDTSIIYWTIDNSVTQTISFPPNANAPIISAISQDGTILAIAYANNIDILPISTDGLTEPTMSIDLLTEENIIQTTSKMELNQDGTLLSLTSCVESVSTSNGESDEEVKDTSRETDAEQPTSEPRCFLRVYELSRSESNPKFHECELPNPLTTAVSFLTSEQLSWSGQRNEGTASELYIFNFITCARATVTLPSSHTRINAIAIVNGMFDNFLVTAGAGLQWWRMEENTETNTLHPIGSTLRLSTEFSNVFLLTENPTLITQNQINNYSVDAYNVETSNWSRTACNLARRNLTLTEWTTAFPLDDNQETMEGYPETCHQYGFDFGRHITLALEKFDDARINLKNCHTDTAKSNFELALEIAPNTHVNNLRSEDFNQWAIEELIAQQIQSRSDCDDSELEAALRFLLDEPDMADEVMEIANLFHDGQIALNSNLEGYALGRYEAAFRQISATFPESLHPIFYRTIVPDYANVCAYQVTRDYEIACDRLAQFATTFPVNSTLLSNLDTQQMWRFEGEAGAIISIKMEAEVDSLQPLVMVFDRRGILVDSDSGNQTVSIQIPFSSGSQEFLVLTSATSSLSGPYQLTIEAELPNIISLNQPEVASTQNKTFWVFEGQAGELVNIRMNAIDDSLDPYLTLLHEDGEWLREDDDGADFPNAFIPYELPETGRYFIQATGARGSQGGYELIVEIDRVTPALQLIQSGEVLRGLVFLENEVSFDDSDALTANEYNEICWFGSLWRYAADVLFACETAVSLEPENGAFADSRGVALALTGDLEGAIADFQQFIDSDYASNEERTLRIDWIEALSVGDNPFLINGSINEALLALLRGDSVLLLDQIDEPVRIISLGESIIGNTNNAALWSFVLNETTNVSISMDAQEDSLDPYLYLFNESGIEITNDDDDGPGLNSLIIIDLEPGTYYIRADSFGDSSGEYELTLRDEDN